MITQKKNLNIENDDEEQKENNNKSKNSLNSKNAEITIDNGNADVITTRVKNIIIPNSYLNNRKNKNMMSNNNKGMYDNQSTEKPTIVNNVFISQPNTQKNMNMPGSSKKLIILFLY